MGLAGLLAACVLAATASTAQAAGPLSGTTVAVASAQATAKRAVTPAINTAQRSAVTVRRTVERSTAPVAAVSAPVAQAPATVARSVATTVKRAVPEPASTSPEKSAKQRKTARDRRGGGAVAKAAIATPAPSAKRVPVSRSTAPVAVEVAGTAAPQRSVSPHPEAPQHAGRGADVAPVKDPAPAPAAPSSAAAATAAGSAAGATAFLALFALIALAAPRLGSLVRLPAGVAPMPPVLALPERPG